MVKYMMLKNLFKKNLFQDVDNLSIIQRSYNYIFQYTGGKIWKH